MEHSPSSHLLSSQTTAGISSVYEALHRRKIFTAEVTAKAHGVYHLFCHDGTELQDLLRCTEGVPNAEGQRSRPASLPLFLM